MNNIKKYIISLGYTLGVILIFTIILSLLSYFNLLNDKVIEVLKLVISIIATIVGGFFIGKNSDRKGYKYGIKFGLIVIFISFLLALIFEVLSFTFIIYGIIIILSSMAGSMIGINKKVTSK